jgi:hypothetical protein
VERVVVIGPARSNSFQVVGSAKDCDVLIGSGPDAPNIASRHGVPLVWDGDEGALGVLVWGGSPRGLTLALAAGEPDPQVVALADPDADPGEDRMISFPLPIGRILTADVVIGDRPVALGRSDGDFVACYVKSAERELTIIDDTKFLRGVALAAGAFLGSDGPMAAWDRPYPFLQTATEMGLVLGEA